jgi:HK97 family phage portal protein
MDLLDRIEHRLSIEASRPSRDLLSQVEHRASLENPRTSLSNPAAWLYDALGARMTDAGVRVSEFTAMRLSTWWACVKVLSETLASVPVNAYQALSPRGKRKAVELPQHALIKQAPNSEMTSQQWRELSMAHVATWGNAFSEIERDQAGRPIGLWPLMPDRTKAKRIFVNGVPTRVVTTKVPSKGGTWKDVTLPGEDVLHIAGLGYDGIMGYSVVRHARQAIGLALATEEFGARWFGGGSHPSGFITTPATIKPEARDRIRTSIQRLHGGMTQAHRIAVLDEGMKWTPTSIPPEDAQFLGTRAGQVPEICRYFRMPPHMVQDLSRGTFSNIEVQSIEFVRFTMLPWFVRWEEYLNRALLTPAQRKQGYFIEFLIEGLLRGALKERYDAYAIGRQWGWLCADDICELENMNPLPDGQGRQYIVPMNMIPADQAANVGQKPEAPPPADAPGGEGSPIEDPGGDGSRQLVARGERLAAFVAAGNGEGGYAVIRDARQLAMVARAKAVATSREAVAAVRNYEALASGGVPAVEARDAATTKKQRQHRSAVLRNKIRKALLPTFHAAGAEVVGQLTKAGRANLKKARSARADGDFSLAAFMAGMQKFADDSRSTVKRKFKPVLLSLGTQVQDVIGDELGQDISTASLDVMVDDFADTLAGRFLGSAIGQLKGIISEMLTDDSSKVQAAIDERFDQWDDTWPDKLADRESVRGNGAISKATYQEAGVLTLTWVAGDKSCGFCARLNGQTVSITESFANQGDELEGDEGDTPIKIRSGEGLPHAPAHDGCDCGIAAG